MKNEFETLMNHPAVVDVTSFQAVNGKMRIRVDLDCGWWYERTNGDTFPYFLVDDKTKALSILNDEDKIYQLEG